MSHSEKAIQKDKERLKKIELGLLRYEKKATSPNSPSGKKLSSSEKKKIKRFQQRILILKNSIQAREADNTIEQQKSKQREETYKKIVFGEKPKHLTMNWKLYEADSDGNDDRVSDLTIRLRFEKFSFANTSWWVLSHADTSTTKYGGLEFNASISSFLSASSKDRVLRTELSIKITLAVGKINFSTKKVSRESLKESLNLSLSATGSYGKKDVWGVGGTGGASGGWEWSSGTEESWQTTLATAGASFPRDIRYTFESKDGKLNCKVLEKKNIADDLQIWGLSKTVRSTLEKIYSDEGRIADTDIQIPDMMLLKEKIDDRNFLKGI